MSKTAKDKYKQFEERRAPKTHKKLSGQSRIFDLSNGADSYETKLRKIQDRTNNV